MSFFYISITFIDLTYTIRNMKFSLTEFWNHAESSSKADEYGILSKEQTNKNGYIRDIPSNKLKRARDVSFADDTQHKKSRLGEFPITFKASIPDGEACIDSKPQRGVKRSLEFYTFPAGRSETKRVRIEHVSSDKKACILATCTEYHTNIR